MSKLGEAHEPVLVEEILSLLDLSSGDAVLDGTLGWGGHAEAILETICPGGRLIGLDVHDKSIVQATVRLSRFGDAFRAIRANFADFAQVAGEVGAQGFDGILLDLGISLPQILDPELGMSFQREMPLNMAFGAGTGETAAGVVNSYPEHEIRRVLLDYGEEPRAYAIAAAIIRRREAAPIRTTTELAEIVASVAPRRGKDPATKTFLALRAFANREYENLDRFLAQLPGRLAAGGRACIISYNSLEDGRVKRAFGRLTSRGGKGGDYTPVTRRPVRPTAAEIARNPRSRSAMARCIGYRLSSAR